METDERTEKIMTNLESHYVTPLSPRVPRTRAKALLASTPSAERRRPKRLDSWSGVARSG